MPRGLRLPGGLTLLTARPAARPPEGSRKRLGWLVVRLAVFTLLAGAYSIRTPLGEGPDEPAHLEYLRTILRIETLPAVPEVPSDTTYEFHQPPMAYAVAAATVGGWWQWENLPELRRSASFDFSQPPKRYVEDTVDSSGWWPARVVNGWWAAVFVPALWLCSGVVVRENTTRAAAWCVVGLSPQVLFAFATFSNDAAAIALSTLAFACLLAAERRRSGGLLVVAALLCGLALWAKLTAAFLVFPLLVVALRWTNRRTALAAASTWFALLSALLVYQAHRGIPWGHAVPPSWQLSAGSTGKLVTEADWLLTLWLGTWAKLGWFNVHLPTPLYLWFLVPTIALAVGGYVAVRARTLAGAASLAALAGAFGLLLLFLTTSDWQPQGRLLLPAIGPGCALTALGFEALARRCSWPPRWLAAGCAFGSVTVCLYGLRALHLAYAAG